MTSFFPSRSDCNSPLAEAFISKINDKLETYWNNVLFPGESKFNIFGYGGRITAKRRKNKEHSKNLVGTVKQRLGGIFVWGCMSSSASGLGNLV